MKPSTFTASLRCALRVNSMASNINQGGGSQGPQPTPSSSHTPKHEGIRNHASETSLADEVSESLSDISSSSSPASALRGASRGQQVWQ